jgi:hypothetical protein
MAAANLTAYQDTVTFMAVRFIVQAPGLIISIVYIIAS